MAYIELTQGYRAQVDDEDLEYLSAYKWRAMIKKKTRAKRYIVAATERKGKTIFMHRLIWARANGQPVPTGLQVDHIEPGPYFGLDNRRDNLRAVTPRINMLNCAKQTTPTSSVYKGVYWNHETQRWVAYVRMVEQRQKKLLWTTSEDEAARAYDLANVYLNDDLTKLNFSDDRVNYLAQLYTADLPDWFERISR